MASSSLPLAPSSSLESDSHRQLRYVRSGMEVTSGATLDVVARGLEGEDREAAIKELRETMAEYVRMERDLVDSLGAVEDVRARMAAEAVAEEGEGARQWDVLAEVASAKEERTSGAIELEVAKHPELIKFERRVDEILGRASFEPSSSNVAMKEEEDEDCVATQVTETFLDPLTKRPMRNPVKNSACGHVYDREPMLKLLRQNSLTRCPFPGCPSRDPVRAEDLHPDRETKRRILAAQQEAKKSKK